MTSEVETLKTNEFLRRRKLRIQQVREQSKDIAKKIRLRANAAKFRSIVDLDSAKGREYLEQQDKLVKKLEHLYAKSLNNFGASHKKAAEVILQEEKPEKADLSQQRARAAVAELRTSKQEKLDERKKSLDRKLKAREIANEISREKTSTVANKFEKVSSVKVTEEPIQPEKVDTVAGQTSTSDLVSNEKDNPKVTGEMATQWDYEAVPNEWQPHVPALALPKDDSTKDSSPKNIESKSDKSKRPNLFALSDEMPSSLRGGLTSVPEESQPIRPSLTLVSDYIQHRDLRLREPDFLLRKPSEDMQSIKQTILRTRASKGEGSLPSPVCHVADVQVVPVPSWKPQVNCGFCPHHQHTTAVESKQFKSVANPQMSRYFSSVRPVQHDWLPSPVLRGSSPFKRTKVCPGTSKNINMNRSNRPRHAESGLTKKSSVTMYNHSTRDVRDVQFGDKSVVVRDPQADEDAFSQAMKETSFETTSKEKDHQKKLQDMRNKIAITKQNVEKEYKDTMAFLKTIPKDSSKPIKNAYKDDQQQQRQKECRQRKLQHEYTKIQRECRKHPHMSSKFPSHKSKSPVRVESDDDFNAKDFQYSWMPVPESDGNLAIHTIPTTFKENKLGNTVKFSKVDSYHEYRSRHKHTPPTRDTPYQDKQKEMFISEENDNDSDTSLNSDTSSVENLRLQKSKDKTNRDDGKLSDAERIIIYKILDTKSNKKADRNSKAIKDIAKSLSLMTKEKRDDMNCGELNEIDKPTNSKQMSKVAETRVSFEQLKEGVYKTVNDNGDNIASVNLPESPHERSAARGQSDERATRRSPKYSSDPSCSCDNIKLKCCLHHPSASTSTSSFKTATNDKATSLPENDLKAGNEVSAPLNPGLIKLVDEQGQESGKFYIGATGFLKDDAYEVIIQLRKKDGSKAEGMPQSEVEDKAIGIDKNVPRPPTPKEIAVQKLPQENEVERQKADSDRIENQCPEYVSVATENQIFKNQMSEELITNVEFDNIPPKDPCQRPSYVNHGVYTSVHDNAITSNFAKASSGIQQPANSVSTQTTIGSPVHRPVFMHMSSSTSTAYMSPPDHIMPSFLKHRDKLDSISDEPSSFADGRVRSDDQYEKSGEQYEDSVMDRYCHKGNTASHKQKTSRSSSPSPTNTKNSNKFKAPPNTARSTTSGYYDHNINDNCRRKKSIANSLPKTQKKCKKYERHVDSKHYTKTHSRKSRPNISSVKGSTGNSNRQLNKMLSRHRSLGNNAVYGKLGRYDLNPVVKWYVDKLLKLNKDGRNAIDVANQECSTVATPGSSIIDVRHNINRNKSLVEAKISLEQIKDTLAQQVLEEYKQRRKIYRNHDSIGDTGIKGIEIFKKFIPHIPKKKSVHKVKSLNISRNLASCKTDTWQTPVAQSSMPASDTSTSAKSYKGCCNLMPLIPPRSKPRSKSYPSPRRVNNDKLKGTHYSSHGINVMSAELNEEKKNNKVNIKPHHDSQRAASSADSDTVSASVRYQPPRMSPPLHISTQTSRMIDDEINYIKLAESKLQNMEKIANLTEKCTKRLSNLAKVLDEVRKNKSIAYSQVSDSASDSDKPAADSDKPSAVNSNNMQLSPTYKPIEDLEEKDTNTLSIPSDNTPSSQVLDDVEKGEYKTDEFVPFLKDIPKPNTPNSVRTSYVPPVISLNITTPEQHTIKNRGKPPPALSRRCLKRAPEIVVPHELSTVIEVDSPLSNKFRSRIDSDIKHNASKSSDAYDQNTEDETKNNAEEQNNNPDLVQSNANLSRRLTKMFTDTSDETKLQMMDLKKFNEIMLKPFISIQEYAKQCNVGNMEEPSNMESTTRNDVINDELSSLHSDGSLPDVIAELLKRKIINEPFKFDTVSNVNSNTASSESTISILALSKMKKDKRKSGNAFSNKENIAETSDTLSVSSNPDLENAFKKLGMGWASSTLKKTKERMAMSSSSNTSSSSLSHFKLKTVGKEIPALVTDSQSTSNVPLTTAKVDSTKHTDIDGSKNVEQQTSKTNSMTVKQFLDNELAKKITFSNKSRKDDTEEDEFISLYETKMPDDMKNTSKFIREDRSVDSNNRARTSTPVQIFKSNTYHSSTSSNMSNGLFSNADDLSSVKGTSNSMRNNSTSDKDDLTIPNFSLRTRKALSDRSKSD